MKMKQEHYEALGNALLVISSTVRTRYQKEGLSDERYIWDCFWHVCDSGLIDPQPLYTYLNDTHIETALKKILL